MNVHSQAPSSDMPLATDLPQTSQLPRSAEIIEQVKRVFAEKGFDGASMQDLARAAGMSAGNFYRYFPSKEAIITSLCGQDVDQIRTEFEMIMAAPNPMEAFRAALDTHIRQGAEDGALWVQIEAAAARRPELAAHLARTEQTIVDHMLAVFAHLSGRTLAETTKNFTAHARLIILLVQELSVRSAEIGGFRPRELDPALGELVIRTIERTVSEIMGCSGATGDLCKPDAEEG